MNQHYQHADDEEVAMVDFMKRSCLHTWYGGKRKLFEISVAAFSREHYGARNWIDLKDVQYQDDYEL